MLFLQMKCAHVFVFVGWLQNLILDLCLVASLAPTKGFSITAMLLLLTVLGQACVS